MSSFNERMMNLYGKREEPEKTGTSWIPKRLHYKGDMSAELREGAPEADGLSSQRIEKMMQHETLMTQGKMEIFEQVAVYLLERYGEKGLEERLAHFGVSWEEQYAKHGPDLISALVEMIDTQMENPFVNYRGYINKKVAKEAIRQLRIRRKNQ